MVFKLSTSVYAVWGLVQSALTAQNDGLPDYLPHMHAPPPSCHLLHQSGLHSHKTNARTRSNDSVAECNPPSLRSMDMAH